MRSFSPGALGVVFERGGELFNVIPARFSIATQGARESLSASTHAPLVDPVTDESQPYRLVNLSRRRSRYALDNAASVE
jgi:hypothetical protein